MLYITKHDYDDPYNILWIGKYDDPYNILWIGKLDESAWYEDWKIVEINRSGTNGWKTNSIYFKEHLVCKL